MFGKPNHIVPYCVQPKNNNNKYNLSAKRGGYNKSSFALNMGEASFSSARLPIDDVYIMQSYKVLALSHAHLRVLHNKKGNTFYVFHLA